MVGAAGPVDILFNCAGFVHQGTILECEESAWDFTMNLNVKGMYRVIRAFLPAMLDAGGGSIINISSMAGQNKNQRMCSYGSSKAAVDHLTRNMAFDLGPDNIRVNALSAGPMRTLAGSGVSDARVIFNFQRNHAPLRRTPTLDEVGGSALYLLSPLSGAVTGEVHFVDCGYSNMAMPNLDELKHIDANDPPQGQRPAGEAAE